MTVRRPENTDDAIRAAFLVRAFVVRFCGYGSVALCVCVCVCVEPRIVCARKKMFYGGGVAKKCVARGGECGRREREGVMLKGGGWRAVVCEKGMR